MIDNQNPVALVIMNPAAGGGRGLKRWDAAKPRVSRFFDICTTEMDRSGRWKNKLNEAVSGGVRIFFASGGDGTVQAVIDQLVRSPRDEPLESFTLGAVGTGSSNDYHKPYHKSGQIIPVRMGPERRLRDVCRARYKSPDNYSKETETYFVTSASIGLVAKANAFFSGDHRLQKWLNSTWTNGAITHAALHTLAGWQNIEGRLNCDGYSDQFVRITNLSITKTQWLSGNLQYDTPVNSSDGLFTVNFCENMSRVEAMRTLLDLRRGIFSGVKGRKYWRVPVLKADFLQPVTLELDGEVFWTKKISFDILSEQIGEFT